MKKILYLTFLSIEEGNGISNKIIAQVEALRKRGHEVHLMNYKTCDNRLYLILDDQFFFEVTRKVHYLKTKMYKAIEKYIFDNGIDILYFRYNMFASSSLVSFLSNLGGHCIRLLEIPTYPYDSEFKSEGLTLRIANLIERHYRQKFRACLDKIVTFVDLPEIYGVQTIKISNAVNADIIPISNTEHKQGEIRLIAVANINFWHGLDRIIRGMYDYYQKFQQGDDRVFLTIVGDGNASVKNSLKELVSQLHLNEYIFFIGNTSGDALNLLFDKADLAIGCLGCHRKSITTVKSLKNVEYAMRGLPFIYSEVNDDFDNKPYVIKIKADDSIIDVGQLITDYKSIVVDPVAIRNSVRNLTWDYQMGVVIDKLN